MFGIPRRYIPFSLSKKDKTKQKNMILKSRKLYKSKKYFTRKKLSTFKSKPSNHIINAKRIYNINKISPSRELSKKTGCSLQALKKIVNKGEGAYYSSGSRPNQTAQSWGLARLASSITGGKASQVDFSILEKGCSHTGKAYRLAKTLTKAIYSQEK
jgi:DNA-binding Xre family transcriptional regulator